MTENDNNDDFPPASVTRAAGDAVAAKTESKPAKQQIKPPTPMSLKEFIAAADFRAQMPEIVMPWIGLISTVLAVALGARLYRVQFPNTPYFEPIMTENIEKFLAGEFATPTMPPLATLINAFALRFAGLVENKVDLFESRGYAIVRFVSAACGAGAIALSVLVLKEVGVSIVAAAFGAALLLTDNALLIQSRVGGAESLTHFLSMLAVLSWIQFYKQRMTPFSGTWSFWLVATGVSLGLAVSSLWSALTTVAWIAAASVLDVARISQRTGEEGGQVFRHIRARLIALVAIPVVVYTAVYFIYFSGAPYDGNTSLNLSDEKPPRFLPLFIETQRVLAQNVRKQATHIITDNPSLGTPIPQLMLALRGLKLWHTNTKDLTQVYMVGNIASYWITAALFTTGVITWIVQSVTRLTGNRSEAEPTVYRWFTRGFGFFVLGWLSYTIPLVVIARDQGAFVSAYLPSYAVSTLAASCMLDYVFHVSQIYKTPMRLTNGNTDVAKRMPIFAWLSAGTSFKVDWVYTAVAGLLAAIMTAQFLYMANVTVVPPEGYAPTHDAIAARWIVKGWDLYYGPPKMTFTGWTDMDGNVVDPSDLLNVPSVEELERMVNGGGEFAETVKERVKQQLAAGGKKVGEVKDRVVGGVKEKVGDVKEKVGEVKDRVVAGVKERAGEVKEKVGDVKDRVVGGAKEWAGEAKERAGEAKDYVVSEAKEWAGEAKEHAGEAKDYVVSEAKERAGQAKEMVGEAKEKVGNVKDRVVSEAKERAGQVKERAGEAKERAGQVKDHVVDETKERAGQVKERAGEVKDRVVGGAKERASEAKERAGEVKDRVVGEAKERAGQVKERAGEVKDRVVGEAKERAGEAKERAGEVKDRVVGEKDRVVGETKERAGEAKERVGDVKDRVGDVKDRVVGGAKEWAGEAKERASEAKDRVVGAKDRATDKVIQAKESIVASVHDEL
ncbi:hypothetical protein HDU81_002997 [Chytriomyces hyalinus]|nr:hypothetical protein HDU81_002997 [Chytriomyces hyalinus]